VAAEKSIFQEKKHEGMALPGHIASPAQSPKLDFLVSRN
jgi:hypothetical protein